MLSSQINNGEPRVLIGTEQSTYTAATSLCNLYFIRHRFEGANTLVTFPFRRNDTLREKFDDVLSANSGGVAAIVNK